MVINQTGTSRSIYLIPQSPYMQKNAWACAKKCVHVPAHAHGVLVLAMNGLRILSYPKFWCITFLYDKNEEVRKWNIVLACAFRKGHVHVATCTWRIWFEHVHIKEGPRDAGEKQIGISRSGC